MALLVPLSMRTPSATACARTACCGASCSKFVPSNQVSCCPRRRPRQGSQPAKGNSASSNSRDRIPSRISHRALARAQSNPASRALSAGLSVLAVSALFAKSIERQALRRLRRWGACSRSTAYTRSFGAGSYFADNAESLSAALGAALTRNEPACINVMVDLDPIPPFDACGDPCGRTFRDQRKFKGVADRIDLLDVAGHRGVSGKPATERLRSAFQQARSLDQAGA